MSDLKANGLLHNAKLGKLLERETWRKCSVPLGHISFQPGTYNVSTQFVSVAKDIICRL
jgi:hypothetical protein